MRHTTRLRTSTRWTIATRPLPARLGHIVRLEDGSLFRGPATLFGLSWWWRPTARAAVLKGFREVVKAGKALG